MSVAQYQNSEDFIDPWDIPSIGRPLINLLCETLETKIDLHPWLLLVSRFLVEKLNLANRHLLNNLLTKFL